MNKNITVGTKVKTSGFEFFVIAIRNKDQVYIKNEAGQRVCNISELEVL